MPYYRDEITIGGRKLSIETGKLAQQANGSVIVQYGDTLVLATATASKEPRPDIDFFPLTVDYEERLYAAGKIPGSFFRREGRPSEGAILISRLTDRPLRPLFPKGWRNDVQIIVTALSADQENEPDILSIIGASAALTISDIPFEGPVAAVKVGYMDGELVINPTVSQLPESELELVVAGTADAVVMVEAGAVEVPEDTVIQAIRLGHEVSQQIIAMQGRLREAVGKPKIAFTPPVPSEDVQEAVNAAAADRIGPAVYHPEKGERENELTQLKRELVAELGEQFGEKDIAAALDNLERETVRRGILEDGRRPDGRALTEVRPITCDVGVLPRTHGSGLFTRGQTQVLTIATLGSIGEKQIIDGLGVEETKRFMHHYNFPPFSVGEVRRIGSPGRREIGHGALAERAISTVIPDVDEFPYTIRLVSEVLSSNGSTSMGSVCGSTLSLMDAGVPIKAPVAGAAMGLITDGKGGYAILTDIQGVEDHVGDMDFKVAGTTEGITALQMDIKVKGISPEIMERAMAQARQARLFILERMMATIAEVRPELSPYAPRILRTSIPVDKIGALIGPGGKNIRGIQESTGAKIDVEEDGTVFISCTDPAGAAAALSMVEGLTKEVEVGATYKGKVARITNFGAFVEILPGKEGLVRIGELTDHHVDKVEDVVKIGDEIEVKVIEIDSQGRINLSHRVLMPGQAPRPIEGGPRRPSPEHRGRPRPDTMLGGSHERRPSGTGRPGFGDRSRSSLGRKW
ncbi:MAG: polyribonucleotide nucleotidyltransferase [Chloroflexi bacterium]|nr:polyribonucleotide nucleotidyltransferase [Chloroflexota bacterium]MCL5026778.1 polyribonucleotide nucleotidyltransferase [Chloroflexota bacterium]